MNVKRQVHTIRMKRKQESKGMRYYKTIQITLTEGEYADVMKACTRSINETGTPVSVTRYAKGVLMDACAMHASSSAYADQDEVQETNTEESA